GPPLRRVGQHHPHLHRPPADRRLQAGHASDGAGHGGRARRPAGDDQSPLRDPGGPGARAAPYKPLTGLARDHGGMKDTFRIGRIAGVSVGVSWSLLAVAALLTFGLAGGRYPVEAAGYSGGAYAASGVVTAVLFLGSVLAHEL